MQITPTWEHDGVSLYLGDCLDVLPTLDSVDAVITDPPYGVNMLRGDSRIKGRIQGDREPPDIRWVAEYPAVVWGGNNFCDQLPRSTGWLVWYKYAPEMSHHSQAELAWTNTTKTIRHHSEQFTGFMRQREGQFHPTQKPIRLMMWCIHHSKVDEGAVVLDPYLGSGTTGVACVKTGRRFIGIEIDEGYFEIAKKRIMEAQLQMRLPI